jgi:HPt (histidine-containing phosphotransfer) domain-containing protein
LPAFWAGAEALSVDEILGSPLAEAMNRLWVKYLPQMEERAGSLRKAAESAINGNLTAIQQQRASSDAHKLAGVLGTFGMNEGTELAREAESLCSDSIGGDPLITARLAAIAEQLRAMIANRR